MSGRDCLAGMLIIALLVAVFAAGNLTGIHAMKVKAVNNGVGRYQIVPGTVNTVEFVWLVPTNSVVNMNK